MSQGGAKEHGDPSIKGDSGQHSQFLQSFCKAPKLTKKDTLAESEAKGGLCCWAKEVFIAHNVASDKQLVGKNFEVFSHLFK